MRRRRLGLAALVPLALAACGVSHDVGHLASEPLADRQPPATDAPDPPDSPGSEVPDPQQPDEPSSGSEPGQAPSGSAPDPGDPAQPPSDSAPDPGDSTQPLPGAPSPGDSPGPEVVEPELPADCEPLPEDAPGLIVTGPDGGIYQAGPAGAQVLVAPGAIGEAPHYAFRGEDGSVWFATNSFDGGTIYTYDDKEFEERASGSVSFQHVGLAGGETAAVYSDFDAGTVVVETTGGDRTEVAQTSSGDGTVGPLGIGDGVVTMVRRGLGGSVFEYVTTEGEPHEGWHDPAAELDDGVERTLVAPDPGNERLAWFETASNEAVVADIETGEELARVELETSGFGFSSDFTGRWYVYTDDDPAEPTTYLVDVDADEPEAIVPCVPIGKSTIDRLPVTGGEGGDEPEASTPASPDVIT